MQCVLSLWCTTRLQAQQRRTRQAAAGPLCPGAEGSFSTARASQARCTWLRRATERGIHKALKRSRRRGLKILGCRLDLLVQALSKTEKACLSPRHRKLRVVSTLLRAAPVEKGSQAGSQCGRDQVRAESHPSGVTVAAAVLHSPCKVPTPRTVCKT